MRVVDLTKLRTFKEKNLNNALMRAWDSYVEFPDKIVINSKQFNKLNSSIREIYTNKHFRSIKNYVYYSDFGTLLVEVKD